MKNPTKKDTAIVTQATTKGNAFDLVKREFEKAFATGNYADQLQTLAATVTASVINKLSDPQRKSAATADRVSNSGCNSVMMDLRRGVFHDIHLLADTRANADRATAIRFTNDGDPVQETADPDALAAFGELISETLTDGVDLIQTAALAILEQAAERASDGEWMDTPFTIRRLSKRVYIHLDDSAAYRDEVTTPMQEVYRAVRRAVENSRAVQTDPRNGYCYIEDLTENGLDTIYHRMGKYADLGGYNCEGQYTTDRQTAVDYEEVLTALELTTRQRQIITLRMQGKGYRAIATYLGVSFQAVQNAMYKVQAKCEKVGFTPSMWAEMDMEK